MSVNVKREGTMRIGELSRSTNTSARSLRYYEHIGLISTERKPNGYREYSEESIATVRTIRMLLDLGFPTSLISDVIACNTGDVPSGDCSHLVSRMTGIRDDIDAKAEQLGETSRTLSSFIERASATR